MGQCPKELCLHGVPPHSWTVYWTDFDVHQGVVHPQGSLHSHGSGQPIHQYTIHDTRIGVLEADVELQNSLNWTVPDFFHL